MSSISFGRSRAPRRARTALIAAVVTLTAVVGVAAAAVGGFNPFATEQVGQTYANGVLLPSNQWIAPLGTRILDNQGRLVSSAISPNGVYLAALGWNEFSGNLTIIDLQTNAIVSTTWLATGSGGSTDYSVAADGPLFSPDGSTLWVPQSTYLLKFSFDQSTGQATQEDSIALCGSPLSSDACNPNYGPSNAQGADLPSGMALSPDGSKLYVALNGANALGVIDTSTDQLVSQIPVGNAPRQVVLSPDGTTAYVSNEGGRPATPGEFTNLSDGTPIVSSTVTGAATTGTVSVVNLLTGTEETEIPVGLQPTALYQDGSALFVANSNDDSLSVINEQTNTVSQTVKTNPVPGATVGSYANAINMSDPSHVLVSIGRDNAIAVYSYSGISTPMRYLGLLPTDWYPVQVQPDPALGAGTIVVTNDKGVGALGPESTIDKGPDTAPATGHNTYDDTGSVTVFQMPADGQIPANTQSVFTDNDWEQIKPINQGDYDTVPSVIPTHLGGYSPIKHVVVIIRENRTYDQDLGDLTDANGNPEGNGDPADAQFGLDVTPNGHALAQRFGDLDNFYDEGTLSADGHNWIVQAEANDYVEKEFGAFYRSYPSQGGDALAYQRDGFLWNAADKAGLSVRNFGEYIYNPYSLPSDAPSWDTWYLESRWLEDGHQGAEPITDPCQYTRDQSDIPSLQAISDLCFPNFQLTIPGSVPGRPVDACVQDLGGDRADAEPVVHVADDRSHDRLWDPGSGRAGRRQRPRSRPCGRCDLAQQVLALHGDLHPRGRHPERRRPRRRAPRAGVRGQPLLGDGRRRPVLHPARHGQDDRADPRDQADEPGGPRRRADVLGVHVTSGLRAVRRGAEPDPADARRARLPVDADRRAEGRDGSRAQGLPAGGDRAGEHAQRRGRLGEVDRPAGRRGPLRSPGHGQPGAAQPVRLVLGPQLAGRVSRRFEDLHPESGAGTEPPGRVHRQRLTVACGNRWSDGGRALRGAADRSRWDRPKSEKGSPSRSIRTRLSFSWQRCPTRSPRQEATSARSSAP